MSGLSWSLRSTADRATVAAKSASFASDADSAPLPEPMSLAPVPIDPPPTERPPDPEPELDELHEPLDDPRAPESLDSTLLAPLPSLPPAVERLPARRPPPPTEPTPVPPPPAQVASEPVELHEAVTEFAPQPVYPQRAVDLRYEGTVTLLALVKADGRVEACEVETSSGFALLDEAARAALKRWKFKPRMVDGSARPFTARVPFQFFIPKPR